MANEDKYREADRREEANQIPLTAAQKDLALKQWDDIDHRGDSLHDFPTYIKHWETAKPWGWELRILTENGLNTFNLRWKNYKRPHALSKKT